MMKIFRTAYLALILAVLLSTTSLAYIDPSVMTYVIQVVAGILVAAGAIIGIYWRRVKRNAMKKLGIDENVKKEVEDDIIEISVDKQEGIK
ncbi:MAG: uncharacterized protein K0S22_448 [Oscillospiraceae bacterium]|jgi:hypothetical protein|nr:uncharacterized protein [Oscillospiraceae bacterium]